METKEVYELSELFRKLPITLVELGRLADVNEVTVARIRDGKAKSKPRRSTVNRILAAMSAVYDKDLNLDNVKGIEVSG